MAPPAYIFTWQFVPLTAAAPFTLTCAIHELTTALGFTLASISTARSFVMFTLPAEVNGVADVTL